MGLSNPNFLASTAYQGSTFASAFPAVILDEFLVHQEWYKLLKYTLSNVGKFTRSEVVRPDGDSAVDLGYRRSRVLFELGEFGGIFRQRLLTFLPYMLARLGYPPFPVTDVEIQLTGSNHGEFFRVHSDNEADQSSGRQLTFVYFFHREPRQFGGGELKIFKATRACDVVGSNRPFRLIYPRQNQIVVFPSAFMHEILPVVCPSRHFDNSRFTVNGWFHR
jgi:Rps23 Pro-64 3,4-dihydroxylase Tpa1-like proline 4-hydroxylase